MKAGDAETIDRVRDAEGAENKIKVIKDTTNQWLKIDAQEVLSKIHELERTLNNHKRHTAIPTWAQSITTRLEGADAKLAKLPIKPAAKQDSNKPLHHLTDEQYKKINGDFHKSFDETGSVFDTQTIDLRANVERLQEQLNLRPTSSELSKVKILLNDVKNSIHNDMIGLQVSSYQMVEDRVAGEVGNISKKMDLSEHKREQGIESTMKKTERFHQLIATVKEEVDLKVLSVEGGNAELLKKFETYEPRYEKVEKRLNDNITECTKNFENARKEQAIALQNFTEYKGSTNITLEKLQKLSVQIDEKLKAVNTKLNEKDAAQTERFNAISERVEDFLRVYEFDISKAKDDVNKLKVTALERQHTTLTDHSDFLGLLKQRDIMKVVVTHEEHIASIFKSMEDFESRLATQNDIIKMVEGMIAIVSDEMEHFPEMVTQQTLKLIKLHQLLDKSTGAMAEMRSSYETVISQVSELYAMSSDVAEIKDAGARSNDKVDAVQAKLDEIKGKADKHDEVIQNIRELLGEIENNVDGALIEGKDDLQNEIIDMCGELVEKTDKVLLDVEVQHAKLAEHNFEHMSGSVANSSLDPNSILDGSDSEVLSRPAPVTAQHAEIVAQMCLSFEGLGARTNTIPDIPDTICDQLLHIAEQLTKHTASTTDLEAVESLISEDNLKVNAESLAEKSKAKIDRFVDQCRTLVDMKNPPFKITQLRNDCRDKYFNLFIGSLYSLLSSHDQVITVGNSRFGRTKIPTRETPKKPSREILYSSQSQQRTTSGKGSRSDMKNTIHNVPITTNRHDDSASKTDSIREDSTIQSWSKLNLPSVPVKPNLSSLSVSKSEENLQYVMKSGFKMPLKNKAGSIVSGNGSIFDDDSVQESRDGVSVGGTSSMKSGTDVRGNRNA